MVLPQRITLVGADAIEHWGDTSLEAFHNWLAGTPKYWSVVYYFEV